MWQNCILRHLQTWCSQALIQSQVSENSTIALFTEGSYVHSYKFKICVHNSLQNNGVELFVVKILADGVRRAVNSDVLASIFSMQFGKFQRILKSFQISVNISSVGEGIRCACRAVHMAQGVWIFVRSYYSYYEWCNFDDVFTLLLLLLLLLLYLPLCLIH